MYATMHKTEERHEEGGIFILMKFLQRAVLNLGFGISFAIEELSVDGTIEFVVAVVLVA